MSALAVTAYVLITLGVIAGWAAIALAVFSHDQTRALTAKRQAVRERRQAFERSAAFRELNAATRCK